VQVAAERRRLLGVANRATGTADAKSPASDAESGVCLSETMAELREGTGRRLNARRGRVRGGALAAVLLAGLTVVLVSSGADGAVPPAGFTDTQLVGSASNPLSTPTAIVPLLDTGRALVLEKGGAVRVLGADGVLLDADALTLSVCTSSEEGLLGAAVDPGFASNGFVYLYYTHDAGNCASTSGRFNRVSRFTMTGDTIAPASEVVLLDNMSIPAAGHHNGGDLHVGNDGDLYVSVGDGGTNPRGSGPSAAQDMSLLNGKILRITTSGGVPADNPFVGAAGATSCATAGLTTPTTATCTEIYDDGLRNPFRFAFDPNTSATRFFINDVGLNTWEEVDQGGSGLNYGWDLREGFCDRGSSTACPPTPPGFTDPLTVYNHTSGCTYITAGAFIPNGIWPSSYDNGYLFGDGGCGKVFLMTGAGSVDYANPFIQTSGVIVDMAFLTQGGQTALYYVTNSTSQIHKVTFTSATGPIITGIAPTAGPASGGTTVTISGSGFTGATNVLFGTLPAVTYTVDSDTQITAISPAQLAGPDDVSVITPTGTSAQTGADTFTYGANAPAISRLSPTFGPTKGGTAVTVTGSGFTGATRVTFGTLPAVRYTVNSDTQITAVAPAQPAGALDISVVTPSGASAQTSADTFTYTAPAPAIRALSPSSGPTNGGTVVRITGSGFTGATNVVFGTLQATSYTVVSDTQITAVAPAQSARARPIRVTASGGTSALVRADTFTYKAIRRHR
jgi:glucose/arabinose dehydrogenase